MPDTALRAGHAWSDKSGSRGLSPAPGWHLGPDAGYREYAGLAGEGYAGFGPDLAY